MPSGLTVMMQASNMRYGASVTRVGKVKLGNSTLNKYEIRIVGHNFIVYLNNNHHQYYITHIPATFFIMRTNQIA